MIPIRIRTQKPITTLRWFDLLILTLILFGQGIYVSTMGYIGLLQQTTTLEATSPSPRISTIRQSCPSPCGWRYPSSTCGFVGLIFPFCFGRFG